MPAAEGLGEVLHGGLELAVAAAELLEQKARELRIGPAHASVELQLFDVVKHKGNLAGDGGRDSRCEGEVAYLAPAAAAAG